MKLHEAICLHLGVKPNQVVDLDLGTRKMIVEVHSSNNTMRIWDLDLTIDFKGNYKYIISDMILYFERKE